MHRCVRLRPRNAVRASSEADLSEMHCRYVRNCNIDVFTNEIWPYTDNYITSEDAWTAMLMARFI